MDLRARALVCHTGLLSQADDTRPGVRPRWEKHIGQGGRVPYGRVSETEAHYRHPHQSVWLSWVEAQENVNSCFLWGEQWGRMRGVALTSFYAEIFKNKLWVSSHYSPKCFSTHLFLESPTATVTHTVTHLTKWEISSSISR